MPFFIPFIAAAAGASLLVWGTQMIIDGDDSADKIAGEFLRKLPSRIRQHVKRVDYNPRDGFIVHWKIGAPDWVQKELSQNIG